VIERLAAGVVLAAVIALAGRSSRALSTSGAIAAMIVGATSVASGWSWGALLLAFFLSSSVLSRIGIDIKRRRTSSIVEKGDERDAVQVLANGGVFAVAALGAIVAPWDGWLAIAGGALAAATADTWATEIGTLGGSTPRMLTTWRVVPTGTSGGVTGMGTLGMVLGSAFLSLCLVAVGGRRAVALPVFVGGIAGALADSLAGATVQARRRCASCDTFTERAVHSCGTPTVHAGGIPWVSNDAVNALCTMTGAASALAVMRMLG
jgi:uncharacterized protein (TIGR00297 family)